MRDEHVRDCLDYDPSSGVLTWKPRQGQSRSVGIFNALYAGKVAGGRNGDGYLIVKVYGRYFQSHRVAWFLHYGVWPNGMIDHIDGNRTNNSIDNLREANSHQNAQNRRVRRDSASGVKGVRATRSGAWVAQINTGMKIVYLGTFPTIEAAHAAYVDAAKIHFKDFARAA